MPEHILLSTVGISDYEQTRFVLGDGRDARAALSPVALVRLLDADRLLLAHTAAVQEETAYIERVRETCTDAAVETVFVEVPLVRGRADVDRVLDSVMSELADTGAGNVTLDITHAYRSLQLALYTAVVQLAALDVVDVDALYYAEDAGHGGTAQILDLTYLYTLTEWHHALRSLQTAGTLGPLQRLLSTKRDRVYREGGDHPELADLDGALVSVGSSLDAGLPLETGVAARNAVELLDTLDDRDFVGPEGAVLDPLAEQLEPFAVDQTGVDGKRDIALTAGELARQRDMVLFYTERGREWVALECARELFLNRVLHERRGSDADWLDTGVRHECRHALTGAVRDHRDSDASPPAALRAWDELSEYRNSHAHAGFDPDTTPTGDEVRPVIETVCERVDDPAFWEPLVDWDSS